MSDQVIEAGRLASFGELAAGIAHEINNPVAIIILTGHGSEQAAREGIEKGAFDYFIKPCDLENLLNIINAACNR